MKHKQIALLALVVVLGLSACQPPQAPAQAGVVVPTPGEKNAPVQPPSVPVLNTPAPQPPAVARPTAAADAFAPNPLTVEWIDFPFNLGGCMDLDNIRPVTDASCDVALSLDGWLITPQNGGLFSGYGSLTPPSRNECKASVFSNEPIALMTDLYLCFKTNQGVYGFFVMRRGPENSVNVTVFDAYLFP